MFNIFGNNQKEPNINDLITSLVRKHISEENLMLLPTMLSSEGSSEGDRRNYISNKEYIISLTRNRDYSKFYIYIMEVDPSYRFIKDSDKCKFIVDNFNQIEACLDDINKQLSVKHHDKVREDQCQKKCAQRLAELVFQKDC